MIDILSDFHGFVSDSPSENGIGSPVQSSPQPIINSLDHNHHAMLAVPVSLIPTPIPVMPTPVTDIVPQAPEPLSSSPSSSSSSPVLSVTTIAAPKPLQPVTTAMTPSGPSQQDAQPLTEQQQQNSNPESDESDIEPCEIDSEDVSRTRAFDWTAWKKKKKVESEQGQVNGTSSIPVPVEEIMRTENNNTYPNKFSDSRIQGHPHMMGEGQVDGVTRPMVTSLGMSHHWTPSVQVSQSLPQVSVGQDTKPPLLSASRSITTATASITKPIVSIGTGAFSATVPKEPREGLREPCKDGKEESSKVYAPINWPPVATEVSSKDSKTPTVDSPSRSSDLRNGFDARPAEAKTNTVAASQSSPEKDRAPHTPSSSASEEHKRLSDERKHLSSPSRKEPPRPDVPASSNYSEYLRQLGRVPAVPPPG